MELFNKLKKILFDEVTEEIPVITKDDKAREERVSETVKPTKKVSEEPKRRAQEKTDDVVIQKIETPKRERHFDVPQDDEPFDMPKLKEEAKEEVKKSTFTFPVFDDDEKADTSFNRRERKEERRPEKERSRTSSRERDVKKEEKPRRTDSVGYTNAYDYSYGKYKGDYKSSREQSHELLTKTLERKEERKAFTPSPVISPVWGVLNENYKKEDIVSKSDNKKSVEPLDLDSVRKKAYGTLEDEIEISLSRQIEPEEPEEPVTTEYEDDDEGISINDLLVDSSDYNEDDVTIGAIELNDEDNKGVSIDNFEDEEDFAQENLDEIIPIVAEDEDEMISSLEDDEEVSISFEEDISESETDEEDDKNVLPISALQNEDEELEEEQKEKSVDDKNESIGEEDLFDLIESIYERKDEE